MRHVYITGCTSVKALIKSVANVNHGIYSAISKYQDCVSSAIEDHYCPSYEHRDIL